MRIEEYVKWVYTRKCLLFYLRLIVSDFCKMRFLGYNFFNSSRHYTNMFKKSKLKDIKKLLLLKINPTNLKFHQNKPISVSSICKNDIYFIRYLSGLLCDMTPSGEPQKF